MTSPGMAARGKTVRSFEQQRENTKTSTPPEETAGRCAEETAVWRERCKNTLKKSASAAEYDTRELSSKPRKPEANAIHKITPGEARRAALDRTIFR